MMLQCSESITSFKYVGEAAVYIYFTRFNFLRICGNLTGPCNASKPLNITVNMHIRRCSKKNPGQVVNFKGTLFELDKHLNFTGQSVCDNTASGT